jgi:MFS family permease
MISHPADEQTARSWWRALPVGVAGVGATIGFGLVAVTLAVLTLGYGCGGSDVSEPTGAKLCNTAAETPLGVAMIGLAIGGPLFGTVAATFHRSWRPLFVGCLIALTAITLFVGAFNF